MTPLLSSAFVIFREGIETWLIMVLALASTGGNLKQQRSIWISAIAAFIATILLGSATAAWLGNHANLERFEALIAIITGVILAWVAWFCHGAAQHVKDLPKHSAWALGITAFFIIFREGVEVVLFLTGIYADYSDVGLIGLGSLVGLVVLVIAIKVANYQIKKLPVKQIFLYSRWLFTALAVYFLYSGIHELIEHGVGF
jgi:high-affinity iron transporter